MIIQYFLSLYQDDNFENKNDNFYFQVKFTKKITFSILEAKNLNQLLQSKNNYLFMKIRKESFLNTIYNKRSWEDISIGFQNKQFRKPNTI